MIRLKFVNPKSLSKHGASVLILNKQNQLLLIKRRDIPIWVLPGGGIETNESPQLAAVREALEETGFTVKIVRQIARYLHPKKMTYHHYFHAQVVSGQPKTGPETKDIGFFSFDKLPHPHSPSIPEKIADYLKNHPGIIKKRSKPISLQNFILKGWRRPDIIVRYLLTRIGVHLDT